MTSLKDLRRTSVKLALLAGILAFTPLHMGQGALVQATFNDNSAGNITGQFGGSGWDPARAWTFTTFTSGGTGPINVVAGDLSAPVSTNYALSQSGTAQHLYNANSGVTMDDRLVDAGGMSGTIWISFLARVDAGGRAGIQVDDIQVGPYNRILVRTFATSTGTGVNVLVDPSSTGLDLPGASSLVGSDILILARLSLNTSGASDTLDIWANPDVTSASVYNSAVGAGQLSVNYDYDTSTFTGGAGSAGVQYFGAMVYAGGHIDNLVASNGANAYSDVTGYAIPEPHSVSLILASLLGLLVRNRRRAGEAALAPEPQEIRVR